jgi:small-conductance mechanosensitive channel
MSAPTATDARSESFFSGATTRIPRFMAVLAVLFTAAAALRFGWRITLGFTCGCGIAYLNFRWLEKVVAALVDRAAGTGNPQASSSVVFRFLMRYFLMAAGAYVIFSVSPASLYGLFAGLFLPVAGIACEAAYELYAALVRGV